MICIVSNDSGGAELISSWIKTRKEDLIFVLSGPATKIFKKKMGKIKNANLKEFIELDALL